MSVRAPVVSLAEHRLSKFAREANRAREQKAPEAEIAAHKERVHAAYLRVVAEIMTNHPR